MRNRIVPIATLCLALASAAAAEPLTLNIPGRGWSLELDVPALSRFEGKSDGARFQYMARSATSGITLSVHVEPWQGGSDQKCRDEFWAKGSRNPLIKKESVEVFELAGLPQVSYLLEGQYQGQYIKQANANFYFVQDSSCVDIHVAKYPYEEGDEMVLAAVGDSLKYRSASAGD